MHAVLNVHVILFKRFKQIMAVFSDVKIYEVNKPKHIAFIALPKQTHARTHMTAFTHSDRFHCCRLLVCENAFK